MCAYQGLRNLSFSENFVYVLNEWSLRCSIKSGTWNAFNIQSSANFQLLINVIEQQSANYMNCDYKYVVFISDTKFREGGREKYKYNESLSVKENQMKIK